MNDIKKNTAEEIQKLVGEARAKLQAFRFAMTGGKQKNVKEGRNIRKEIARMLTELTARAAK